MVENCRNEQVSEEIVRHAAGSGNWRRFIQSGLTTDHARSAATEWSEAVAGRNRLWLCWSVDPEWNVVRLVLSVGWTPAVGYDPRTPVLPGSILVDSNKRLRLPTMWPHFPLEFAHLWAPSRLAFWHADLLVRLEKMRGLSVRFARLPDGWMAAVKPKTSLRAWLKREPRYRELIGCTTRQASEDTWNKGCGWWSAWPWHPSNSAAEHAHRKGYYWDSGTRIHYWHKFCPGRVDLIPESYLAEGHFTGIGKPHLADACRKLDIEPLA